MNNRLTLCLRWFCCGLIIFLTISSRAGAQQPGKELGRHISEPYRVPVKPRACTVSKSIFSPGKLRSSEFFESKSSFGVFISEVHVDLGSRVRKGQLIASTSEQFLAKSAEWAAQQVAFGKMHLSKVLADVKYYKDKADRLEILAAKQLVSTSVLEAAESEYRESLNTEKNVRKYLVNSEISLREAQDKQKQANFYAGGDGVVTQLIADRKSMTGPLLTEYNSVIVRVDKPGRYVVETGLLDSQVQKVRVGQKAQVELPDSSLLPGTVTYVSSSPLSSGGPENRADVHSGKNSGSNPVYRVSIALEKDGELLPQDLPVTAEIFLGQQRAAKCLPWNAVKVFNGKPYLSVFASDRGWTFRPVKIGLSDRTNIEVISVPEELGEISAAMW